MTKVVISDKALREMVAEVLDNTGWSGEENSPAVTINPITDPSAPVTDPVNPHYSPQNKTEFGVAMGRLVKNLPDSEMPGIYRSVKTALDQRSEKDEMETAEKDATMGGSQEAIDANKDKEPENEGKTMSTDKKLEEQLRARIRGIILEVLQEAGELPPVKKIPFGVHGAEYMRRQEKTKADLRKSLGHAVEKIDEPEPEEEELPGEEAGEEEAPKRRAYKSTAIGSVADVQGKSFEEIAKELGFSVAGAKQAVDKAMLRFSFMYKMPEEEREDMLVFATADYIDMLNKTGELTAADVRLLKDHPEIVQELEGFREFFHNVIRKEMKGQAKIYDPIGRPGKESEPDLPDDDEEGAEGEAAPASEPAAGAPEAPRAGKATYKIYGKMKGAPAHTRVKGKAYLAPSDTQFAAGEQAKLEPSDGKLKVSKTDSDHSQTWEPESDELPEADVPGQIKGKSVADPRAAAAASAPAKPGEKSAKMGSGKKATIDWGGFAEGRSLAEHLLQEAAAMVMQDHKGPYVIADGVEARPANPNRTQYKAGTRVNVHRHGKKGIFIVEMPNGERWTNKPIKG